MKFPYGCFLRALGDDRVLLKNSWLWYQWDLKARGAKWYVVESSTYLASLLVAASSAAAAAVIDVDVK